MTYAPPPHCTQNWALSKPSATGLRGLVVSQVRSASEAGLAILDAGGNAIDAAVATALALAAVEPWNSGLGGTGFALVHRAGQSAAEVVDFGPVAPRDLSVFKLTGRIKQDLFAWPEVENDTNIHGPLSFAIPSATVVTRRGTPPGENCRLRRSSPPPSPWQNAGFRRTGSPH